MDFEHAKRVGIEAIYSGARVLRDHFGHISQINQKSAFDDQDLQILQTLADQLAIAIDNLRLLVVQAQGSGRIRRC